MEHIRFRQREDMLADNSRSERKFAVLPQDNANGFTVCKWGAGRAAQRWSNSDIYTS